MDLKMRFLSIGSLRADNCINSTNLFLVFVASVLAYLVFIHITSIHFSISLLVVFRVQYFTFFTSPPPVLIHLPHSAGIHLPYSAAIFSLATHRFGNTIFSCCSIHPSALFRSYLSNKLFTIFFTYHLPFVLPSHATCHPEFH